MFKHDTKQQLREINFDRYIFVISNDGDINTEY